MDDNTPLFTIMVGEGDAVRSSDLVIELLHFSAN